jgi:hypothetical protein
MAQGDLFSDLMNKTGLWGNALKQGVIDTKQLRDIQEEIAEQQKDIYEVKREMLKSDHKGINIFKRIASSGSKILAQTEKIHKTKKSIQNTEKRLVELAKDYGKAKKLGNSTEAEAIKKEHQALQVKNAKNKIGLQQMQRTIPLLGKMGGVGNMISGGLGAFMSVVPIIGDIIGGIRSDSKIHDITTDPRNGKLVISTIDSKGEIRNNSYYSDEYGIGMKYDKDKHNPM